MQIRTFPAIALIALGALAPSLSAQTWRSSLYPANWTPGYKDPQGRFVHDFSYAGYKQGLRNVPAQPPGVFVDVVNQFGADPLGGSDSSQEIQAAIDHVGALGGGIVYLPPGVFRCTKQLFVRDSKVVIRGERPNMTTLFFTNWLNMQAKSHITFDGDIKEGADIKLAKMGKNQDHFVYVQSSAGLSVGDDVHVGWVITPEFVAEHGMTGTWTKFNGQWRPFFRRKIVGINKSSKPHRLRLDVPLRYPAKIRDKASIRRAFGQIERSGIEHLSISNAVNWNNAWSQKTVHVIEIREAINCWVRNVESVPSPSGQGGQYHLMNGGVVVKDSKNVTIMDSTMAKAQHRGGGGSGYLFEVQRSNEVLIKDCVAFNGRHNLIQNWDFGTSGCVFLRCKSWGSRTYTGINDPTGNAAFNEYHHSLAMACLVDQCTLDDGWLAGNRGAMSQGAGHTSTQSVFWNTDGKGLLQSWQYGDGYVIGTENIAVITKPGPSLSNGAAPEDFKQGIHKGSDLQPQSLYEDQLARRKP